MERTKRKNVFRAELIIFLAVIAVSLLVLWIRWENSHATYKNYDIVVKKNVYCEKTQTGRVDLQIRRKGGKKAKLLQTQQELKQSQSFQIVEDSYKLGIVDALKITLSETPFRAWQMPTHTSFQYPSRRSAMLSLLPAPESSSGLL